MSNQVLQVKPFEMPGTLKKRGVGKSRLSRACMIEQIEKMLELAEARRTQYGSEEIPLYGKPQDTNHIDCHVALTHGQLVMFTTQFADELLKALKR